MTQLEEIKAIHKEIEEERKSLILAASTEKSFVRKHIMNEKAQALLGVLRNVQALAGQEALK